MLSITGYNNFSRIKVDLHCPKCDKPGEISLPALFYAINHEERFYCADCNTSFRIISEYLTRATEQRNEADTGGQDAALRPPTKEELDAITELHKYQRWA